MSATTKKKAAPVATSQSATEPTQGAGLGLAGLGDLSALLTDAAPAAPSGGPLLLALELIDEDPHQPRTEDNPGFSDEAIAELGTTIKHRGVKTPISVRDNPDAPGRYLINHGARRYRASKWAGKTTIPAFIDNDHTSTDQVIENLQRNELTAREIADHIGRELAKGKKKGEIAEELGKSAAFVSQHVTLLDLPEPIAEAFNAGRCKDVTVINELVKAHKKNPEEVSNWLADDEQEVTRGSVKLLREFLDAKKEGGEDAGTGATGSEDETPPPENTGAEDKKPPKEPDPEKLKKAIVQVKHDNRPARLALGRRPSAEGSAWIKYEDDGHECEVALSTVQLVAVLEG